MRIARAPGAINRSIAARPGAIIPFIAETGGLNGIAEQLLQLLRVTDVGLQGDGLATGCCNHGHGIRRSAGVTCVVDDDGEAVGSQTLGNGAADAAGCAGHQRGVWRCHGGVSR